MNPGDGYKAKSHVRMFFKVQARQDAETLVRSAALGIVLLACLSLALLPPRLYAGQDVRVFVETEEQGQIAARAAALEQALSLGVVQEAEVLLRHGLEGERLELLREILGARAADYVLGYSELGYEPTEWGGVLHVDVRVNRNALRDWLQFMGVYYTVGRAPAGYTLETEMTLPEDEAALARMETLSGLSRRADSSPVLRLGRTGEEGWQGVLEYDQMSWSAQAASLAGLWAELWGNYFTLESVAREYENHLVLETRGWGGTMDVFGFDRILRSWEVLAAAVHLRGVSLQPGNILARWELTTMDRAGLEQRLGGVLRDRGVEYVIASR